MLLQSQLPQQSITTEAETSVTLSSALGGNTSNPAVTINSNTGIADAATDDWHIRFSIPDLRSFSHHVKDAVTTGVITARARKEIIQVLRTYITADTIRPTSEQYTTVCRKLVERYPSIKDTKGKTKYVSSYLCNVTPIIILCRAHGNWGCGIVSRTSEEAAIIKKMMK